MMLRSQLSGNYANWSYSIGIELKFQEDGTFQYQAGKAYGEGVYVIKNDTLSLHYREVVDSMMIDCSESKINQSQNKYSADSIRISIVVLDCHSNTSIPYPIVSLYNGNPLEELISVDDSRTGDIDIIVAQADLPLKVLTNAIEYLAVEVSIPSDQDTNVEIITKLHFDPIKYYISGGGIRRFIIVEEKSKYIKLKELNRLTEDEQLFYHLREKWSLKKKYKKMTKYFRK